MKTLIFGLLLFTSFITEAQPLNQIESFCKEQMERYGLRGIGITVVKGNQIVLSKTYGRAGDSTPFTDSSRVYIASNTKAFIGLAIADLVSKGQLKYTDPISEFFADSLFTANIDLSEISLRDLLQHTHGLSNDPIVFRTAYSGEYPSDLRRLLRFTVYRVDSASHEFKYGNLGYLLAGLIIEQITGEPWKQYLEEHIFSPLHMGRTTANLNFEAGKEVLPFEHGTEQSLSSRKSQNTLHAAGGIFSTMEDMGKWLTLFTDRTQTTLDTGIIKLDLNTCVAVGSNMGPFTMDEYGNGWITGSLAGQRLRYHFGSFYGYESIMSFQDKGDLGVYVFVNERIAGLRVAAKITAYTYLVMEGDTAVATKANRFDQFIDPLYEDPRPQLELFHYHDADGLTGTYLNEKYGQLLVDKSARGYTFLLGKLKSPAYAGDQPNEIRTEWIPGLIEHFTIGQEPGKSVLKYGGYGTFVKQ